MASIWTTTVSPYGTYTTEVKPVSNSTARRWLNEGRTKARQSRTMRQSKALVAAR